MLCSICEVKGPLKFKHLGSSRNNVEFNAEVGSQISTSCQLSKVGLLSHNIRIKGELGNTCTADKAVRTSGQNSIHLMYGNQVCKIYAKSHSGGIRGGQIVAIKGFSAFRMEQVLADGSFLNELS